MSYIDDLRANEYVREKDLGDGVSSFNFTRQAFLRVFGTIKRFMHVVYLQRMEKFMLVLMINSLQ